MIDKAPDRGTVFISYSHKDKIWKDRLVKHLGPLRKQGLLEIWEDSEIQVGDRWDEETRHAISQARVAVLLVSADYLSSEFIQGVELPRLLERAEQRKLTIIPVIVRSCGWQEIPWLASIHAWFPDGKPLSAKRGTHLEANLAQLAQKISEIIGGTRAVDAWPAGARPVVSNRLPVVSRVLVGREQELKTLDEAWESHIRILSIEGMGGIGKSTLVSDWLSRMADDEFRGAKRVFTWSFHEQKEPDHFFREALHFFGDPHAEGLSPLNKTDRLVDLLYVMRTLLVLDGFDALQNERGRILYPAMEHLLRKLSLGMRGLVILTSRLPLPKWSDFQEAMRLERLSDLEGTALLRTTGVRGTEQDLASACRELDGHPLALVLLGSISIKLFGGDIRQWREAEALKKAVAEDQQIRTMLGAYERLLKPPELAILRLSGFFDRPITSGELAALCKPPISKLTDVPEIQSEAGRLNTIRKLSELGLLTVESSIHAHPLVRRYFHDRLQEEQHAAFHQGNARLFQYLSKAVAGSPQTLEEMSPLIAAVEHGCAGGLLEEAVRLFRDRIARGDSHYLTRTLGATETGLRILARFFETPWERPWPGLDASATHFVLDAAGHTLQAAGRCREAQIPLSLLLEKARNLLLWKEATATAQRLSEVQLSLGRLKEAQGTAMYAVDLAMRSGDPTAQLRARITLADVFHQMGRLKEARKVSDNTNFSSYRNFDLQLSLNRVQPVLKRISSERLEHERTGHFVRVALAHLALGRSLEKDGGDRQIQAHFDQAVEILRRGVAWNWFPAALNARALFFLQRGRLKEAERDLIESLEIATQCELRLQEADAHIGFARLHLATDNLDQARQSLSRARALVDATGYHRRDGELRELEERLTASATATQPPVDPVALAFRLVLAGHALPDLLLHPDPQKIEEAARLLSEGLTGDPLAQAQRHLEEQQPGVVPNPLWASWLAVTQGETLQRFGRGKTA